MDMAYMFLGIAAIFAVLSTYVRRKFAFWADRNVQFIPPTFPFGNLQGIGKTRGLFKIIQECYDKMKTSHVLYVGLYFFIKPVVLAINLDFVKTIMVKDFQYFHDRGMYHNEKDDPLSAHLFSLDGQKWRNLRTKLTPTFTSGKMKMMFPTIVKVGEELNRTMSLNVKENQEIEIREVLSRFTTDVIGTCAFGLECNSLKDPDAEFRKYGRRVFEAIGPFKVLFTNQFKSFSQKLRLTILPKDITAFFMKAVKDTVAYREEHNIKRNDFMDLLVEMKKSEDSSNKLTIEEIAAQSFIFFLAGFETSSTVMSFALYELALNQKVQNQARKCVQDVLKKNNGELTYESLMEMTYITQCINGMLKFDPILIL
jgi:cytochrome P450 family 6